MERVVVAGGCGFIGSNLVKALLDQGAHVTVLDDFSTGRLENLPTRPGLEVIPCDVTVPLPAFRRDADVVVHLASPASPVDYQTRPLETLACGAEGTRNLLDLARESDARFVVASSSEIYGEPEIHPQPEEYVGHVNPVGPRSMYDEAKRYSEALSVAYARVTGLCVGIVRPFNVYGPYMRVGDGRAIPTFIDQAVRGVPLTVAGDGSQTRSCCYVSDFVEAMLAMAASRVQGPINIGNPEEITVLNLARMIIDVTGSSSQTSFILRPPEDPSRRCPVITRAREALGWEPQVTLREGLARTVDWFSEPSNG